VYDRLYQQLQEQAKDLEDLRQEQTKDREDAQQQRARVDDIEHRLEVVEARLDTVYEDTIKHLQGKLEHAWTTVRAALQDKCSAAELDALRATLMACLDCT
jgi:archaellum component FlaC